jgi:hypothetical protein
MKTVIMIVALAIAGCINTIHAQHPTVVVSDKTGWHKIAETTVSFKKESEEIIVLGADKFASIKLKVKDAPIDLVNLDIYFKDGKKQHVNIAMPIKTEGETRVIDIDGGERDIKKVEFVYKTLPNRDDEKAHVELWGMKTNADKDKVKGTE